MQKNFSLKSALTMAGAVLLPLCLSLGSCSKESCDTPGIAEIETGFVNPEGLTDIAVYWYWLNDNISAEGVVKDLDAMKRAGITRAYIGFQGIEDIPQGKVPLMSDEWWNIVETALSHAGEIGIDIGIFNSPGWSQSGGPWVAPGQAMRYIENSRIAVTGNGGIREIKLPEIEGAVNDIAVIAYPRLAPKFKTVSGKFIKKGNMPLVAELVSATPVTARAVTVTVGTPFRTTARAEVFADGQWKTLREFPVERYNDKLYVGYKPYAPIVIALPETTGERFRVVVDGGEGEVEVAVTEQPKLESYAEKSMAKMFQEPLPLWADYMWDAQEEVSDSSLVIQPGQVVNLTDKVGDDGILRWDVPAGEWEIAVLKSCVTGVTNSPAMPDATGLETDKMNRTHVAAHFDNFIGEILRRIPAEKRKTFKYVVSDSYEVGGQNYTDDIVESFEKKYGYSMIPYLPVMQGETVGSRDMSDRFLWDLRRLVADRVADDYITGLREKSNENGLKLWLENYGHWGYTGEFLQYGSRADEVSGEFWSEGNLGDIENRGASSCAHIYGKNIVWSESCTSGSPLFTRYPAVMKQRVDRFFTEGINSTLLHLYIQQQDDRQPGLAAWFGNEFNRNNVWFDHIDIFLTYLKRCNYMLQQGRYIADVAYFIGEDAPKMTGECNPALPYGYSFDFINGEVLRGMAKVKDGRLVLDSGMEYRVLVLPNQETMRPEMLAKIKEFVKEGLIVVGPEPLRSPSLEGYPESDAKLAADAALLWKDGAKVVEYGKGKVFAAGTALEDVFAQIDLVPDFAVAHTDVKPLFIHRELRDADIYFVSNPQDSVITLDATFRVSDKGYGPQLWNPVTGEISALPEFTRNSDGTVTLPMMLEKIGSAFVVFRKDASREGVTKNIPAVVDYAEVTTPWTLTFETSRRGPAGEIVMETLIPLNESDNDSVKYYSGKTVYRTRIVLGDSIPSNLMLDLGKVMVMGKVKVNGKDAGGVWTSPYRVSLDGLLVPGENVIEVETTGNWRNRMIADDALPEPERLTWSNQWNFHKGDDLQETGLIGPVKIVSVNRK